MGSRDRKSTGSTFPQPGPLAALRRQARVAVLALRGWRTEQIAAELNETIRRVAKDLKQIEQRWREAARRDFDRLRGIEAAKIDEVERCAWDEFYRSREAAQKRTKRKRKTTGGKQPTEVDEATVVDADRVGDPRFLHVALAAIADRRKLFGLDKPTKAAHTDTSGNPEACGFVVCLPSNGRDENRVDEAGREAKLLESHSVHAYGNAGDGI